MNQTSELTNRYREKVIAYRRQLHAHPELSGCERQTAAFIAQTLREMGLCPTENVGGFGVTALIEGAGPGKCIALRADIDALPIPECTGLPFSSEASGVSHSCGHDVHAAMLLGAAHLLCDLRGEFAGTVKLIFQPSEENATESGAKKMIAAGVLEHPHVDAIIGQHVSPLCPSGKITLRKGAISSASDRFFITIRGKSSHASKPETGIDAIAVGSQVLCALQTVVSRSVSPLDNVVLTVGTVRAGTRYNVVSETFEAEGTCRNRDLRTRDLVRTRMESIIRGVTEGMGAQYTFRYIPGYLPTVNAPEMVDLLTDTAADLIGSENIIPMEHASMGGEDFCFYSERIPAVFWHLGCRKDGSEFWPIHNGHFSPDETVMDLGMQLLAETALRFLSE